jgi:serine kinase of HPr protein (carbohydrate metabolism regulator)
MSRVTPSSETVHASAVAILGRAVLIGGLSGVGKSDLALRLIDRGAVLISDDYCDVRRTEGQARASAPATILGKIEMRGIGIVEMANVQHVPIALFVDLDRAPERLPEPGETRALAGVAVPVLRLAGLEASAPLKVEAALRLIGLPA